MNGWLVALLLFAITFAALVFAVREQRKIWSAIAAALVLALAGYATQGHPELAAKPAHPIQAQLDAADALLAMRADMDQSFGQAKKWLVPADSFARSGDYRLAAAFIQSGLKKQPKNGDLWAGLGVVLMLASDGELSEPAKLAFDRARIYAPRNAAPVYFEGLSDLFKGKPLVALQKWEGLLKTASASAKWRKPLESQIGGLKQMLSTP